MKNYQGGFTYIGKEYEKAFNEHNKPIKLQLNSIYGRFGNVQQKTFNTGIYKLKSIQQLPCFNAIDIIKAFTNVGFEIVVDNGDLTILNYKKVK
jgi:hypothetical protein